MKRVVLRMINTSSSQDEYQNVIGGGGQQRGPVVNSGDIHVSTADQNFDSNSLNYRTGELVHISFFAEHVLKDLKNGR